MNLFSYMPLISVSLYPRRAKEQKEEFAKAISEVAIEILKAKAGHIIVVYDENLRRTGNFRKSSLIVANYFILCLDDHY